MTQYDAPVITEAPSGEFTYDATMTVLFATYPPDGADLQYSMDGETWETLGYTDMVDLAYMFPGTPAVRTVWFRYAMYPDESTASTPVSVTVTIVAASDPDGGGGGGVPTDPPPAVDARFIGNPSAVVEACTAQGHTVTLDAAVEALTEATETIEAYCRDRFATFPATVQSPILEDGTAPLPWRVRASDPVLVRWADTGADLTGGRVTSSEVHGQTDAVAFSTAQPGFDILVKGAEPWAGGYARLYPEGRPVLVSATFGWVSVPSTVARAAQLLAVAALCGEPDHTGVASMSVEGYSITYQQGVLGDRSTGSAQVDRMLTPYRRSNAAAVL